MIDTIACLIARVICFFLIDKANEVQTWKLQVYESANCTNLQPITLLRFEVSAAKQSHTLALLFQ